MTDFTAFSKAIVVVLMLFGVGLVAWGYAHHEIATECERQGGFYVDKKDYVCSLKQEPKQ